MNDKLKRKRILKYFTAEEPGLGWAWFFTLGGVFVIAFGASNYVYELQLVGGGMLLIGLLNGARALVQRALIPSDDKIDGWLFNDLKNFPDHALRKLDLNDDELAEKNMMPVVGWIHETDESNTFLSNTQILRKFGKDSIFRSTVIDILFVFTAEDLLAAYECVFDFLKGKKLVERTYQIHYQDIVAVTTEEIPISTKMLALSFPEQPFFSRLFGGKKDVRQTYKEKHFHITVPDSGISILIDVFSNTTSNKRGRKIFYKGKDTVDRTVQRLRGLIKNKKLALASQPTPTTPPPYAPSPASMPAVPEPVGSGFEAPPPGTNVNGGAGEGSINFCSNCGRQVQPTERFCSNCGHQLKT
ncbi:MAG TPA: zinc ribbon domain-containing protein [Anaerolineales bacterium]|nr:zinc ribbon domain-containing protein [Anaerolineales bacterium]